jgi:hypothetical protein
MEPPARGATAATDIRNQQCGIDEATAGVFGDQADLGIGPTAKGACGIALRLDQPQHRPPARAIRSRFLRVIGRRIVRQQHVTHGLQFPIRNPVDFHAKVENGHGYQLCSVTAAAVGQNKPALLKGRENRMQSFF